jgi:hypothetical protein
MQHPWPSRIELAAHDTFVEPTASSMTDRAAKVYPKINWPCFSPPFSRNCDGFRTM